MIAPDQSNPDPADRPEFRFGEGKISGVLAVFLGLLGLAGVIAMLFPATFTTPEMRAIYPMAWVRLLVDLVLVSAFVLGMISVVLSRRKSRGIAALGLVALAMVLGGSQVQIETPAGNGPYGGPYVGPYVALDWFVLSLFFLALIFVPLERAFARLKDQRIFRAGWRTDLAHFAVSHLLVQITVLLTMLPAAILFDWLLSDRLQAAVAAQPLALQFVAAMFVTDLFAYIAHRVFHAVPFLWRFHQVHHSSELLDWLAASRLHVVDILVTRAFGFIPLYVLGFSHSAIIAYLTWTSFQAIFIHANVRFKFGPLRWLLATPQFHHWHHSATTYDKNFAVNLPIIDMMFGTFHLPRDEWPEAYGLEGRPVPDGYVKQLLYPLRRAIATPTPPSGQT